jgi:hypothetical protein
VGRTGIFAAIMRTGLLLIAALAALGVVGAIVALGDHQSDDQFLSRQRAATVRERDVAAAVQLAREPRPGGGGARASKATCERAGRGPSAWFCLVEYASGSFVEYAVQIDPGGRFTGVDDAGERRVSGCCVDALR